MKKTFCLLTLLLIGNYALAQIDTTAIKRIGINPEFSYKMLDQNPKFKKSRNTSQFKEK